MNCQRHDSVTILVLAQCPFRLSGALSSLSLIRYPPSLTQPEAIAAAGAVAETETLLDVLCPSWIIDELSSLSPLLCTIANPAALVLCVSVGVP